MRGFTAQSIDLAALAELVNQCGEKKSEVRVLNPGLNREYTGSNPRLPGEFPGFRSTPYAEAVKEDPSLKNCRTCL